MNIKKELMKIFGSSYMFDYTETIINLLIEKDENNRKIIEEELVKMINKKDKEHMEELDRATEESKNWNLKNTDCIGGQFYSNNDYAWFR
jgi:flagellar biosynthesis/type III secretory pathway chaperone